MRDGFILQHSLAVLEKYRSQFVDRFAERLSLHSLSSKNRKTSIGIATNRGSLSP
jgi:hypothetical protein